MRSPTCLLCISIIAAGWAGVAQAHPGHTQEVVSANSGWHYLLQPEHTLVVALGIGIVIFMLSFMARRNVQQPVPVAVPRVNLRK